jgi:hypothetical protein
MELNRSNTIELPVWGTRDPEFSAAIDVANSDRGRSILLMVTPWRPATRVARPGSGFKF